MSNQDQERRKRFREIIDEMDERYGEVFRRLAEGEVEEADRDEISDEEFQAALDDVNERYGEAIEAPGRQLNMICVRSISAALSRTICSFVIPNAVRNEVAVFHRCNGRQRWQGYSNAPIQFLLYPPDSSLRSE